MPRRDRDKPYRVIHLLAMELEGGLTAAFPLNRKGHAAPVRAGDGKDGMPHWPKKRTVDLRVGDQVFFRGHWRRIRRNPRGARRLALGGRDLGYIYRARR